MNKIKNPNRIRQPLVGEMEMLYSAIQSGWKVSKNYNKENSYVFEKKDKDNNIKKFFKDTNLINVYESKNKRENSKKINTRKNEKNKN